MKIEKSERKVNGRNVMLRSAEESDAACMLVYLKETAGETPFLLREPDEVRLTLQQEETFIRSIAESERDFMLMAFADGKHAGTCSVSGVGRYFRTAHRCSIAIALYRRFCRKGIGRTVLEEALKQAKSNGFEQAELEVSAENAEAIHLYQTLGFETCGRLPDSMRYRDGSCADSFWMVKKL